MPAFSGGGPPPATSWDLPSPWELLSQFLTWDVFENVLHYGCTALLTLVCAYAYLYSLKADKGVRKRCATGDVIAFGFVATLTVGYWITVLL